MNALNRFTSNKTKLRSSMVIHNKEVPYCYYVQIFVKAFRIEKANGQEYILLIVYHFKLVIWHPGQQPTPVHGAFANSRI
ncbi:uncharacterized protein PHALS_01867 [Plasmopara halstedii]|uniref:Uncharacterized protein n=1 Tax=Plasmopara halstedii TaxID=4781 RepID=A0A0P1AWS0_PLAHL|nr:uncharacterized protein PHALS_01867 [Plasmopara halstedii]CEG45581.1 hypothetical protein PHALS_01867 [Plasmopara halstedii]|eukprot:XP_024581950.1 hypothetical protein PHALS_01867 [Plasmopara halstedii]